MLAHVLCFLKYLIPAALVMLAWLSQTRGSGGLDALLASPVLLSGMLVLGIAAIVGICALKKKRAAAKDSTEDNSQPTPREQRLKNQLQANKLVRKKHPDFLVLNIGSGTGIYPSAVDETPASEDVADVYITTSGPFTALEVKRHLLQQEQDEDRRLWWCVLSEFGKHTPQGVILMINAAQLLFNTQAQCLAQGLALQRRLCELSQIWKRELPLQIVLTQCDVLDGLRITPKPVSPLHFTYRESRQVSELLEIRMCAIFDVPDKTRFGYLESLTDKYSRRAAYLFPTEWSRLAQKVNEFLVLVLARQSRNRACWIQSLYFCAEGEGGAVSEIRLQAMLAAKKNSGLWCHVRRYQAALYLSPGVMSALALLACVAGFSGYLHSENKRIADISEHINTFENLPLPGNRAGITSEYIEQLHRARLLWTESVNTGHRALIEETHQLYYQLLKDKLLPDSARRIAQALAKAEADDKSASLLAVYLTLQGAAQRKDREKTLHWLREDWRNDPRVKLSESQRQQLTLSLQTLLESLQIGDVGLDRSLIKQVRMHLSGQSQPQRLLSQLLTIPDEVAMRGPEKKDEQEVDIYFRQGNYHRVTQGLNGRYSREGYQQLLHNIASRLPETLAFDNFIMGDTDNPVTPEIINNILQYYYADYIQHWETFLHELNFIVPATPQGRIKWLQTLAQSDSALFTLFTVIVRETQLLPVSHDADQQAAPEIDRVTQHFAALRRLLSQKTFSDSLQNALLSASRVLRQAEGGGDTLDESIASAPQELHPLLIQLSSVIRNDIKRQTLSTLNDRWQKMAGEECRLNLEERYPFDRQASKEIAIEEFNHWFSPQGKLNQFQAEANDELFNNSFFIQGARLQHIFYPDGEKKASMGMHIRPESMDPEIDRFILSDGAVTLEYSHGPLHPVVFTWPAAQVTSGVIARIILRDGTERRMMFRGAWAWFRMFDQLTETTTEGKKKLVLNFSGYPVRLLVAFDAGSDDPDALLQTLHCPEDFYTL